MCNAFSYVHEFVFVFIRHLKRIVTPTSVSTGCRMNTVSNAMIVVTVSRPSGDVITAASVVRSSAVAAATRKCLAKSWDTQVRRHASRLTVYSRFYSVAKFMDFDEFRNLGMPSSSIHQFGLLEIGISFLK